MQINSYTAALEHIIVKHRITQWVKSKDIRTTDSVTCITIDSYTTALEHISKSDEYALKCCFNHA